MIRLRFAALAAAVVVCGFGTAASGVTLQLTSGSSGGFGYSFLHTGDQACESITVGADSIEFCKAGSTQLTISGGTLDATQVGNALSSITGTLTVDGGTDIVVTGGSIDFDSAAADTYAGTLETNYGIFYFLDHAFAGPANSFDGTDLYLWGNNWDNVDNDPGEGFGVYGIDLGFTVVPEPGTALLFGLGLVALAGRRRGA